MFCLCKDKIKPVQIDKEKHTHECDHEIRKDQRMRNASGVKDYNKNALFTCLYRTLGSNLDTFNEEIKEMLHKDKSNKHLCLW